MRKARYSRLDEVQRWYEQLNPSLTLHVSFTRAEIGELLTMARLSGFETVQAAVRAAVNYSAERPIESHEREVMNERVGAITHEIYSHTQGFLSSLDRKIAALLSEGIER